MKTHCSKESCKSQATSTDLLSDILVLPRPADDGPACKRKQKSVNSKAVCITDDEILEQLKEKAAEKAEAEREKEKKKLLRIQKKEEKRLLAEQRRKEKQLLAERRKKEQAEKQLKKKEKKKKKETQLQHLASKTKQESSLLRVFADLHLSESEEEESREEDTCCPKCGLVYADSDGVLWVCCDSCELWYDLKCTGIRKKTIPDLFYCDKCVKKH